jgi:hypothetical protein
MAKMRAGQGGRRRSWETFATERAGGAAGDDMAHLGDGRVGGGTVQGGRRDVVQRASGGATARRGAGGVPRTTGVRAAAWGNVGLGGAGVGLGRRAGARGAACRGGRWAWGSAAWRRGARWRRAGARRRGARRRLGRAAARARGGAAVRARVLTVRARGLTERAGRQRGALASLSARPMRAAAWGGGRRAAARRGRAGGDGGSD